MNIYFHNTMSGDKELFVPQREGQVSMYVCGPTVYSYPHIGNARPAVVFDVVRRLLQTQYQVNFVRNITDVDDKINKAAQLEQVPIGAITERYAAAYHEDMAALGVAVPSVEPKATDHIPQIIAMVEKLVRQGNAYVAESHVLFSVSSYPDYGRLSGRSRDEMLAGARVEVAPYKEDPGDFVLWKPSDSDQVGWDSPWGYGRPGWHIECSAMAGHHLGETIDIHGGGADLMFPHHENESAQSCCANGNKVFARFWLHNGMIHIGKSKMSKSENNVILLRDLMKQHPAEAVRYAILATHYRSPLEWNDAILLQARQNLDRLYGALREASASDATGGDGPRPLPEQFMTALANDLNTPEALKELHLLARQLNVESDASRRQELAQGLCSAAAVMGLLQAGSAEWFAGDGQELPEDAQRLMQRRKEARASGDYAVADELREELLQLGIEVQDRPDGETLWNRTARAGGRS